MAYQTPFDKTLSESEAKLIAQVGSMKNLVNLSFLNKFNIKKEDDISMFDYMLKVLRAMGIDPQIILTSFLNEMFKTEKLLELILLGTAQLATTAKVKLDSNAEFEMPNSDVALDDDEKQILTDINYNWLNSGLIKETLATLLNVLKTRIIQELMILIFGKPKKESAAVGLNGLTYDENRLNELIDESVCGGDAIFSASNPINDNGELSYNRIQKMEQVKNGNLTFKVTCQGVEISLPDDPTYLFRNAPPGFQGSSQPISSEEAMQNVFNFVNNQIQKSTTGGSSQSNAKSGEKSFTQKFLETLISSITCLLKPFFIGFISPPGEVSDIIGSSGAAYDLLTNGLLKSIFDPQFNSDQNISRNGLDTDYIPATSCDIMAGYDKNNLNIEQKKKVALLIILCNLILNMAIGFILAYLIEKVKKMITKYIVKRAQEKISRKIAKIKANFKYKYEGKFNKKANNAKKQAKLLAKVKPILKPKKRPVSVPSITF